MGEPLATPDSERQVVGPIRSRNRMEGLCISYGLRRLPVYKYKLGYYTCTPLVIQMFSRDTFVSRVSGRRFTTPVAFSNGLLLFCVGTPVATVFLDIF